MRLDLHLHTTASDGSWGAPRLVAGAVAGGLDVIAITDHDTTAAVAEARTASETERLQVIAGIEVSTTHDAREIHVLGYFVDPDDPGLTAHRAHAVRARRDRMAEMIERLARDGVEVTMAAVEEEAGAHRGALARPHLARALVRAGHASSVADAFGRHIGDRRPAFVPTRLTEPAGGVELVARAGGIPVWAHPPDDLLEPLLPTLVARGLRGLEVYRPSHRRHDVLRLEALCRAHGLLATGGSDWHGPEGGAALGDFHVRADEVEAFLEAGGL